MTIKNNCFFCSWSGGKDSALALYRAIQEGGVPKALITMINEEGTRSRSHGLPIDLLKLQADSMNIPIYFRKASWDSYEDEFISALQEFKKQGIDWGVFGDIDLQEHLDWVERVCSSVEIKAYDPLWKEKRRDLLDEYFELNFTSTIVAVKNTLLDNSFLGKVLSDDVVADMENIGIDASGEEGEYHTAVTYSPNFSKRIDLEHKEIHSHGGYNFLEVQVKK